uniref:Uncharacterized protein n=1 Tax=Romanomermis culicivorax TaxID=13658 RepID=A0A915IL53_ROMCU
MYPDNDDQNLMKETYLMEANKKVVYRFRRQEKTEKQRQEETERQRDDYKQKLPIPTPSS